MHQINTTDFGSISRLFFAISNCHHSKASRANGFWLDLLAVWVGLLLHRSNVRSLSKPPILSCEPPKHGIKRRFLNAIDARVRPAHTINGRGSRFVASIDG